MYYQTVYHQTGVAIVAIALSLMLPAGMALAQGHATQRPINDFLKAQGTYCFIPDGSADCVIFVPPVPNFIGSSNNTEDTPRQRSAKRKLCASVDYAGLADKTAKELSGVSFGTTTEGSVTERRLSDGRAEVTVRLHTKNALTWVIEGRERRGDENELPPDCGEFLTGFASQPLLFGHRLNDVLDDKKDAALGDSFLQVVFINRMPGIPLPDLTQLFNAPEPGQQLRSFSFYASADGTLRARFGVPEGTPGRFHTVQTGLLFRTPFKGATVDGFPAEQIILKAIGQ
jgi:hypothetical protein